MKPEEKQLLLKALCSGLPYGIKFACGENVYTAKGVDLIVTDEGNWEYAVTAKGIEPVEIGFIKPYLRPMSSMTEEEKNELRNILWFGYPSDDNDRYSHRGIEVKQCLYDDEKHSIYDFDDFSVLQDFLLKNHFDYHGLIPMGLALEAPEGMYD